MALILDPKNNIVVDIDGKKAIAVSIVPGGLGVSDLGAFITQDLAASKVFESFVFTSRRTVTIAAGATIELWFDPTVAHANNKQVPLFPPIFMALGGDEVEATLYSGATYTAATGTIQKYVNRNDDSPIAADSVIILNPTMVTPGAEGSQWLIPSTSTGAATNLPGSASGQLPFKTGNKSYRIVLVNTDATNAQKLNYTLTWGELPEGA